MMSCDTNAIQRCVHVRRVPKGTVLHRAPWDIPHTVARIFEVIYGPVRSCRVAQRWPVAHFGENFRAMIFELGVKAA